MLREGRRLPERFITRVRRTRTLLLVDDEENILSALKRLLRRDGYHIVTALRRGRRPAAHWPRHEVDVIISDQRMPGMTGVEFLRRAKELYPDTIRMVLSGYTELQSIIDAVNEGAIYKFLTKPWDDERLREPRGRGVPAEGHGRREPAPGAPGRKRQRRLCRAQRRASSASSRSSASRPSCSPRPPAACAGCSTRCRRRCSGSTRTARWPSPTNRRRTLFCSCRAAARPQRRRGTARRRSRAAGCHGRRHPHGRCRAAAAICVLSRPLFGSASARGQLVLFVEPAARRPEVCSMRHRLQPHRPIHRELALDAAVPPTRRRETRASPGCSGIRCGPARFIPRCT